MTAPERARVLRQSGGVIPAPGYLGRHLDRHLERLARSVLPLAKVDLAAALAWAGWRGRGGNRRGFKRVLRLAERNRHLNGYHHPWHTLAVIVLAGMLAEAAGLPRRDREALLLAALIHDLDHRGRSASMVPMAEERRSALLALRLLNPSNGREARAMLSRIEATATSAEHQRPMEAVTAILLDADILASVLLPEATVLRLTRGVLIEQGRHSDVEAALDEFLEFIAERGFFHPVTGALAASLPRRVSAVWRRPDAASRLGFWSQA